MNVLDWCLLALVGLYALSGYWQGFVTGAFATGGLLAGGLLGVWLAPVLLGDADPSVWVSLGALLVVVVSATIGQATFQLLGARIRDAITWQPVRAVDAVGGAALSAMAVLVVAWALGVAVTGTRIGAITPQVRASTVLGTVDRVLPVEADGLLRGFNDVVGTTFFPRYLEPFAPERIVDVPAGPKRMLTDPDVVGAEASIVKVLGENVCTGGVEGSGFLYSPGRVMTNAHVVAGVTRPTVEVGGETLVGTVVVYDPELDIAVLAVDDTTTPHLVFDRDVAAGDPVAVVGYPEDGPFDIQSARVRSQQKLRSPDINGHGIVIRDVYAVRGLIRPGNSGGPVLTSGGDVAGVVFAASVSDSETGYALTAEQAGEAAAQGIKRDDPVATGTCVG
ncbi:MAG: MarP family serine protease [Nocardioides sp.]|uniref:MarP family serine protease n=1 Tax=Nocardioides sp. TaxID=35761 RepID=UPI003EFF8CDF